MELNLMIALALAFGIGLSLGLLGSAGQWIRRCGFKAARDLS